MLNLCSIYDGCITMHTVKIFGYIGLRYVQGFESSVTFVEAVGEGGKGVD